MKVNVPGRGAVDIGHVVVLGPVWTDIDMYRETCHLLQRTADAAAGDAVPIEFSWQPWHADVDDGHMLRQMVRLLAAEWSDGRPYVDGVCMLEGWRADGPTTFAAAVANTCGAVVMGLEECAMWMGRCRPRETAAPAHGEAAGAAQQTYVDVRPALDKALASWDPMEDIRKLMLRSAVD